jgi:hypothetical protein
MSGKCIMRTIASLTANLDKSAVAADNNTGRYLSWWLYFRVVGVGGGGRWGGRCVTSFVSPFFLNSYVECSIKFCMYVDNTKCEWTP